MPAKPRTPSRKQSFRTHQGRVLVDQLADRYHTLLLAVVEMAQNAIDANAQTVFIGIDQQNSSVIVLDDGEGINERKFGEALKNVGQSIKKSGSLGRFGLGMISPLNKCREFRIVSRPLGGNEVLQWTFVGTDIREQYDPEVPVTSLDRMPRVPDVFRNEASACGTTWRTMIQLSDITRDRTISTVDIEELGVQVRARLDIGMREKGTSIVASIIDDRGRLRQSRIDPLEYKGEPLDIVVYDDNEYGKVEFHLYRAPKQGQGRHGEIKVLQIGDNSAVPWKDFRIQALGSRWLSEDATKQAFNALSSGYFEGEIRIEKVKLHSERGKFEMSDYLKYAYMVIEQWFEEYGKKLLANAQEERREARLRRTGETVLEELYRLFRQDPELGAIAPHIAGASQPQPRKPREGSEAKTKEKEPGTQRVTAVHPSDVRSSKPVPRDPRKKAEEQNVRLSFEYDMLPGVQELWTYNLATGTIVFNIRHPDWEACDEDETGKRSGKHDKQIMHLQRWLALEVISLQFMCPEEETFATERWRIDTKIHWYVKAFILP